MIAVLGGLADVERDWIPHPHGGGPQSGEGAWAAQRGLWGCQRIKRMGVAKEKSVLVFNYGLL